MSKPKSGAKKAASSEKLIDELVEKDVKGLRVSSKLRAGKPGGHCAAPPPRCIREG